MVKLRKLSAFTIGFLKAHNNWLNKIEIACLLGVSPTSIYKYCKVLKLEVAKVVIWQNGPYEYLVNNYATTSNEAMLNALQQKWPNEDWTMYKVINAMRRYKLRRTPAMRRFILDQRIASGACKEVTIKKWETQKTLPLRYVAILLERQTNIKKETILQNPKILQLQRTKLILEQKVRNIAYENQ